MSGYDLLEVLDAIDPVPLSYQEWLSVGMALKEEGFGYWEWERWSRLDTKRFKEGECAKKWEGFEGFAASPVTGGTIVELARQQGWRPEYEEKAYAIQTDDPYSPILIADFNEYEDLQPIRRKAPTNSVKEIIRYLEALFNGDEYVNFVMQSYLSEKDNKYLPANKGLYSRTVGEVIEALQQCHGDIGGVFGDFDPKAGAWVRINPLDGKGVNNANVTDLRYCLIESDEIPVDDQNRILRALELPIAALVHSGGKSLHAIVKVEAENRKQYDERVRTVIKVCKDNGFEVDESNKNPARLSRLPGVPRGKQRQYLIDTHIGKKDYAEWDTWCKEQADGLPDAVSLADEFCEEVKDPDVLIPGILARGDKMLLAGPSKAGKSFLLIELCTAFAEGSEWLGKKCQQLDVLYINLELKAESRRKRMQDIYSAMEVVPNGAKRIHSMDLRGKNVTLDKLTAKLVKQVVMSQCKVVIIDPIYKVLEGDENSSEDVSRFCVALDYLIDKLGVSIIYCHHYSKGASGYSASMNRASGSSVFSRDADALISLDELELDENRRKARFNTLGCKLISDYLDMYVESWESRLRSEDNKVVVDAFRYDAVEMLKQGSKEANRLVEQLNELEASCMSSLSAWRVEGTLRDFPRFTPIDVWYQWPLHIVDVEDGCLKDTQKADSKPWQKKQGQRQVAKTSRAAQNKIDRKENLSTAYDILAAVANGDPIHVSEIAEYLVLSEKQTRAHIKEGSDFRVENGFVVKSEKTVEEPK